MKKIALIIFPVIFLLTTCALEIANVIGPGGGYVYYDKGNYKDGWRYKECSPFDIGELKIEEIRDTDHKGLIRAIQLCIAQSDEWYAYDWEIPDEADLKKILECFSYGLTRFSPDYYYLSANNQPVPDRKQQKYNLDKPELLKLDDWEVVIQHKNFDNALNGEVEKVAVNAFQSSNAIRVRPIRKF